MTLRLPVISIHKASAVFCLAVAAFIGARLATPVMVPKGQAPSLEETIPRAFGDWVQIDSPLVQVSLSTGGDTTIDQPYDQTVLRTYRNSKGQLVALAVAWGANQRQEVKIHRPDLCYIAQGYKVKTLQSVQFEGIRRSDGGPVTGKHMYAESSQGGEAVAYWIRIGQLFSEDAWDTRRYIFTQGFSGNVPDGILVRASVRVSDSNEANQSWPVLDSFLRELLIASPDVARSVMVKGYINGTIPGN